MPRSAAALFLLLAAAPPPQPARGVDVLHAVGGIPAHIAGAFSEPLGFQQARSGEYVVFDRRGHAVHTVDAAGTASRAIVAVGGEEGRVIGPSAFDMDPAGTFVVADGPGGRERVQIFGLSGARLGGFTLPGRPAARVTVGGIVLSGVGSVQYTGRSVLINQPERGGLVTEYSLAGAPVRTFGELRRTGHETDEDLHLALNVGLPLVIPDGGYYFVFQTGVPRFRRYDRDGTLLFERHIEGRQLDATLQALPDRWPRRTVVGRELPLVPPTVRTAAVDPDGGLWIALTVPYTYVYDRDGEKRRVVQFRAPTGILAPTSLSFPGGARLLVTPGCYEFAAR